jgi:DNA polymerase I
VNAETIKAMGIPGRAVAFDLETHRVQPGLLTPPLVCGSIAELTPSGAIMGEILDKEATRRVFLELMRRDELIIVGHNIEFDLAVMAVDFARRGIDVMPYIFRAYALGRIFDTQRCEELHAVGSGTKDRDPRTLGAIRDPATNEPCGYRLSVVVDFVLGRVDAKARDYWRERYALLEPYPIDTWPAEARQYPVDDACNTLEVALAQCGHRPNVSRHRWLATSEESAQCARCGAHDSPGEPSSSDRCVNNDPRLNLHDLQVQVFKAWALHLGACWGIRAYAEAVNFLLDTVRESRAAVLEQFIVAGFVRDDNSENQAIVKRAVAIAYGCTGICPTCRGSGKVYNKFSKRDPSKPVGKPINCTGGCDGTGLDLTTGNVPMTDKGSVQIGRDILVESGDEFLMEYAGAKEDNKIDQTYGPFLLECVEHPGTLRPNPILETGRVSYSGVVQTEPRQVSARLSEKLKERRERERAAGRPAPLVLGVRDCHTPHPGWLFDSEDYTGGELVTHAESTLVLVGYSKMGEALNRGLDVHSALGATMMGVSYDTFLEMLEGKQGPEKKALAKAYRQAAKPGNFGFPGRMGAPRMALTQRVQGPDTPHPSGPSQVWDGVKFVPGYKGTRFCLLVGGAEKCGIVKVTEWGKQTLRPTCRACIESAEHLRESWMKQWPENVPYLKKIVPAAEERGWMVQHYSQRIRGGVDGGSIANGWFQAFLADITGRAQIRVSFEQYVRHIVSSEDPAYPSRYEGLPSPLYGSRSILFAHDELFGESPESIASDVAERKNEIMLEEFRKACPHHKPACKAEPTLMRRWYKAAECVRLCPVCGKKSGNKGCKDHPGAFCPVVVWEPKEA